ncbi:MAG: Dihydroorotate dehydrogenase (NAD(+)), catalytic subunit [uncultured Rubrobacteraceae bacterium]|uniref:Dihydroorotate dehydrogenase n=1 Tax=uncultured Rubrobacteraceae bacterium TaxID=349277 RepID=A0A6J4QCG5_9ACTN|nr:MAG: Dihydroorotate dehydrogenase (NAD(+)), catalytic subunit [uncultured Rubrobacteraceae bacterium]
MVARPEKTAGDFFDLAVELCGLPLATPLMPAAGTLAKEALDGAREVYGAMLPKTVTPGPRVGNPPPRVAEVPSGMVNSIGLQNPGFERFLQDLDVWNIGMPLFVSIAADTVAEFAAMCERLAGDGRVTAVELNLSCPNVEHGGLQFCAGPGTVAEVVAVCREVLPNKPLFAKLTNEGVVANAVAAEESGSNGLTLINTIPALVVDTQQRKVFLRGGLSGPAIKPVALRAVYEVSRVVEIPVIGVGGISSGEDVAEFMIAGATAVQVGAGSFVRQPQEILDEFAAYLRKNGLRTRELSVQNQPDSGRLR